MEDEQEDKIDIKPFLESARRNPIAVMFVVVIALMLCFFYLGFVYGYNKAFHSVDEWHKEYQSRKCICLGNDVYSYGNLDLFDKNKTI